MHGSGGTKKNRDASTERWIRSDSAQYMQRNKCMPGMERRNNMHPQPIRNQDATILYRVAHDLTRELMVNGRRTSPVDGTPSKRGPSRPSIGDRQKRNVIGIAFVT